MLMIPKSPRPTLTSYMSSSPTFPTAYRMLLPGVGHHLSSPCANGTQLFLPKSFLERVIDILILVAKSSRKTWIPPSFTSDDKAYEVVLESLFSLPSHFPNLPPDSTPEYYSSLYILIWTAHHYQIHPPKMIFSSDVWIAAHFFP